MSIGNNLSVGANATIGGNLTVSGLTTSGVLNSNTVGTNTIQSGAISAGLSASSQTTVRVFKPAQGTRYNSPTTSTITTSQNNQSVYVWSQLTSQWAYQAVSSPTTILLVIVELQRVTTSGIATTIFTENEVDQVFWNTGVQPAGFLTTTIFAGFVDNVPVPGTYTYRISARWINPVGGGVYIIDQLDWLQRSLLTQTLKR